MDVHSGNGVQNYQIRSYKYLDDIFRSFFYYGHTFGILVDMVAAEWLGAWHTLTMFEATVCGRS